MIKFRERNPVNIAAAGIALLIILLFGSFQLASLPLFGGHRYHALFAEAGGLAAGDKVKVAGTQVGKVLSVDLDGATVVVTFTAKAVTLGNQSIAEIKTQTLLGERNLGIISAGKDPMEPGDTIPIARTRSPYNLSDNLNELSSRTSEIDVRSVGTALDTFSQAFATTPKDVAPALDGITRLSRTINSRNEALETLLRHAERVTGVLRDHTAQLTTLVTDGNALLGELEARRQVIHDLLVDTTRTTEQVSGLVHDQHSRLKPALEELNTTLGILRRNDGNIVAAIQRVSSFITGLGEGLAGGPTFVGTGDLAGLGAGVFPTNEFIPSLAVPVGPPPPGTIPILPPVSKPLGVGGTN